MSYSWYVQCFDINELNFIVENINGNNHLLINFGRLYPMFVNYNSTNNVIETNIKPINISYIDNIPSDYIFLPKGERIGCFMNNDNKIIMLDINQFSKIKHVNIDGNKQVVIRQPKNTFGNYFSIEV